MLRGELGENNVKTLDARHLRADVLRWLGEYEVARTEIEEVIRKREQHPALGPDDSDTLKSRHIHTYILRHLGEYEAALAEIKEVIRKQRQSHSLGPDHPDTLTNRYGSVRPLYGD